MRDPREAVGRKRDVVIYQASGRWECSVEDDGGGHLETTDGTKADAIRAAQPWILNHNAELSVLSGEPDA